MPTPAFVSSFLAAMLKHELKPGNRTLYKKHGSGNFRKPWALSVRHRLKSLWFISFVALDKFIHSFNKYLLSAYYVPVIWLLGSQLIALCLPLLWSQPTEK